MVSFYELTYDFKKKFGHELMGRFWPKVYPILQGENGKNKPENQQN